METIDDEFHKDFLENGFSIFKIENLSFLNKLKSQIEKQLKCKNLENLHKKIKSSEINNERIKCYR